MSGSRLGRSRSAAGVALSALADVSYMADRAGGTAYRHDAGAVAGRSLALHGTALDRGAAGSRPRSTSSCNEEAVIGHDRPVILDIGLIDRFIAALAARRAPMVPHLNPGLSEAQMAALVAPLEMVLPQEAKTWWGYADGVPLDTPEARASARAGRGGARRNGIPFCARASPASGGTTGRTRMLSVSLYAARRRNRLSNYAATDRAVRSSAKPSTSHGRAMSPSSSGYAGACGSAPTRASKFASRSPSRRGSRGSTGSDAVRTSRRHSTTSASDGVGCCRAPEVDPRICACHRERLRAWLRRGKRNAARRAQGADAAGVRTRGRAPTSAGHERGRRNAAPAPAI